MIKRYIQGTLPYLLVFIASFYRPSDPDLGWHLKYGEYFTQHLQPLRENTFATQMADFRWTNISWGVDVLYYLLYHLGGFLGLTIGAAAVITLTFFFFSKAFKLDYWEKAIIFPLILFFMYPLNGSSFRGQIVSLMMLGALVYAFNRFEDNRGKSLYFVPLIFFIWANLHGLFILGLGIFFLWEGFLLVSEYLENKSFSALIPLIKKLSFISVLSIIATIIHPFGIGIYHDALLHFDNPLLKRIAEYLAPELLSQQWVNLLLTAVLAGIGLIAYGARGKLYEKIPQGGVFLVLYLLSMWVKRYSWAMYYLAIPFFQPIAAFLRPNTKRGVFIGGTILFLLYLPIVIFLKYPFTQFSDMSWDVYCREFSACSPKAAQALRRYYEEGTTMTLYNWGGWMIWEYPDMKPSSDGRMHLWEDEKGYSAFAYDYSIEQNIKDVDTSIYNVVFTSTSKPIYRRLQQLAQENTWKRVYQDQTSAIFVRNK